MVERTQGVGSKDETGRYMNTESTGESVQDYQRSATVNAREERHAAATGRATIHDDLSQGVEAGVVRGRETGGTVRNTVSGTLKSVGAVGDDAIVVTRDVLKDAIAATEDVGSNLLGGVAHLAKDLVHGVRDVGGDVATVVKDSANGTVDAVGDIGGRAVHTLTHLLTDTVGGIRQVAGAAVGGVKTVVGEAMPRSSPRTERPLAEEARRPPQRQTVVSEDL